MSVMCPADAELIRFEKRTRLLHPGGLYLKIPAYADLPVVLLDITSKRKKKSLSPTLPADLSHGNSGIKEIKI